LEVIKPLLIAEALPITAPNLVSPLPSPLEAPTNLLAGLVKATGPESPATALDGTAAPNCAASANHLVIERSDLTFLLKRPVLVLSMLSNGANKLLRRA
jgi:hypothetical protein